MDCPKCSFDCPPDFDFCPRCATLLQVSCPNCGFRAPATFSFCPKCATALAAPAVAAERDTQAMLSHAVERLIPRPFADRLLATRGQVSHERRMVTILFCDVKGSTAMAEQLDPEEVLEIMSGAFDFLIEPVYRYEGTLARLMGDAVLAFFGAPIAHEDDPERAIRAALEIVEGAGEYGARLEREQDIQGFNVRVGIHTGLVVVGEVGSDLRVEYTAMGDAVNLASRMEQAAPAGGILITHDTYRHVRGVFDVSPQEPLSVKGKAEPVQTYLVQGAKARAFRVGQRGVEGIETRMVGREAELLIVQNHYLDALDEAETRLVTVVGEAGVGKTRLLDEFFNWLDLRPEQVWYFKGRASAVSQPVPYSLWRDLFDYRFEIWDSDPAGTALSKFRQGMDGVLEPEKADLVGQLVGFDFATAGSEAVQALLGSPNFGKLARAYLVQYFRSLVARQPAVILLEDLQWADDSSLDAVAQVVAEVSEAPLLVVGAARPALFERRPNWGEGLEAHSKLELKPLSRRATRGLVEEILQKVTGVPQALCDLIVEAAEGNPYYVEELIKMLIEDGVIVRDEPHWQVRVGRLAEVRVPPTLTAVLQARLDALPAPEKATLQRASVVGRQFWDSLVGELAGDAEEGLEVAPLLGSLRERELVFQREQSAFAGVREYTFKHTILRDVTYETVLLKLRRTYHAQVAGWLEAHAGERLGEYLGLIAGHYELAGERAKAAAYLRRSGEEAYRTNAYRDARAAFERALRLLPEDGGAERAALAVQFGQALIRLGEFAAARAQLEAGMALARSVGARRSEAAARTGLGEVAWHQGDWGSARHHLQAGLALAQACADAAGQAVAAQHLARVSWLGGEFGEAERWAQESHSWYEQAGDRQGVIAARNELAGVAIQRREFDRARSFFAANLALAREIGDRFREAQALNNLGVVAHYQEAYEEARACYEQTKVIFEEIGERIGVAVALSNLGDVCISLEQDGAAWAYLRQSLQENLATQDTPHALGDLVYIANLRSRAGQPQRAAELLGLALRHPASHSEVAHNARPVLELVRAELEPEAMEAALARGADMDLEQVVEQILAEG
ncbi:MAG: adenylate/guanylate cyclase domain-containing protein [Anaerolineae bacterium]